MSILDVVSAYKGLQAEKAALEASVTALSGGGASTTPKQRPAREVKTSRQAGDTATVSLN